MPKQVAIVESPAKAKTISRYLGKGFVVESSYGHVRDLPKKEMGIDIEHNFEPQYVISPDKKKVIAKLKKVIIGADHIWLATDEDREGEAIAWHLAKALKLDETKINRIVFHEITETAIKQALANPRRIDTHRVDAQQARRVLDRLVGYELSPILWRKIRVGLSAGRVQSVAVRLIVEREREINKHEPQSTFKVTAEFAAGQDEFTAEFKQGLPDLDQAKALLEKAKTSSFKLAKVEAKTTSKSPPPPFTTSSLQQTASNLLGFSVKRTMMLAQRLYEAGYITYMRTDSIVLSEQAITQAEQYIKQHFGDNWHHSRRFQTKTKLAQEAHEAIRPTNFNTEQAGQDDAQQKLYRLIWQRSLATQMSPAAIAKTSFTIQMSGIEQPFVAKGEVTLKPGFLRIYQDRRAQDSQLPKLSAGQKLGLVKMAATETLSKPKARYTEASLVRKLEQLGIGRPSTYAPTISTIQDRGYVEKPILDGTPRTIKILTLDNGQLKQSTTAIRLGAAKNKLVPTEIGEVVNDFLVKYFADVLDYEFTAKVEAEFDTIAQGQLAWPKMIKEFYQPFHRDVTKAEAISRQEATQMRELGIDPKSGRPIFARIARYGPIIQVGTSEDEVKPQFAPIPKTLRYDSIKLDQALELLKLPRPVGQNDDGETIYANIGRFGPYLKTDSVTVSLKEDDPLTIGLAKAKQLIADKRLQEANKVIKEFKASSLKILNGPYGAYVTDGKARRSIPKDLEPAKVTEPEAKKILATPPTRGRRRN